MSLLFIESIVVQLCHFLTWGQWLNGRLLISVLNAKIFSFLSLLLLILLQEFNLFVQYFDLPFFRLYLVFPFFIDVIWVFKHFHLLIQYHQSCFESIVFYCKFSWVPLSAEIQRCSFHCLGLSTFALKLHDGGKGVWLSNTIGSTSNRASKISLHLRSHHTGSHCISGGRLSLKCLWSVDVRSTRMTRQQWLFTLLHDDLIPQRQFLLAWAEILLNRDWGSRCLLTWWYLRTIVFECSVLIKALAHLRVIINRLISNSGFPAFVRRVVSRQRGPCFILHLNFILFLVKSD